MICPYYPPPNFLIFSTKVPALLYYSHIPVILISLVIGFFVYFKNKQLLSKILIWISIFFSTWVFLDLITWTTNTSSTSMFFWSFFGLLFILINVLSFYFVYVFAYKRDLAFKYKLWLSVPVLISIFITPTSFNLKGFDLMLCGVGDMEGKYYTSGFYIFGFIILLSILWLIFNKYRHSDLINKKELVLLAVGMGFFLLSFFATTYLASILIWFGLTNDFSVGMYGLFGMIIFLAFISYLIVRYHTFNIKVLGAQALVMALVILIAATFLVNDPFYSEIIIAATLILVIGLGYLLTKNVTKEVKQREEIEGLAQNLAEANEKLKELDQLKSEFLSLATHQIRAPLTAIKGYSSMLLEGDFGILPQKAKDSIETMMKSCQNLIDIVNDFLNISRIEQGRMVYEKSIFDLAELLKEIINELKPNIQNAGLSLELEIPNNFSAKVNADRSKIKQVIGNIIDNAIKYTVHGKINISIFKDVGKVKIAVKDSGVGIDPNEINKLFNKFSRTKNANKTNISGTGLGLYIAKKIIEANHGDIKVFSEGLEKGTTFTIELPIYKI